MNLQTRRRIAILVWMTEAFFTTLGIFKLADVVIADVPTLKGPIEAAIPLVGVVFVALIYRAILKAAAFKDDTKI